MEEWVILLDRIYKKRFKGLGESPNWTLRCSAISGGWEREAMEIEKKGKLEGTVYEVMEAKETNYFQKKGIPVSFEY